MLFPADWPTLLRIGLLGFLNPLRLPLSPLLVVLPRDCGDHVHHQSSDRIQHSGGKFVRGVAGQLGVTGLKVQRINPKAFALNLRSQTLPSPPSFRIIDRGRQSLSFATQLVWSRIFAFLHSPVTHTFRRYLRAATQTPFPNLSLQSRVPTIGCKHPRLFALLSRRTSYRFESHAGFERDIAKTRNRE